MIRARHLTKSYGFRHNTFTAIKDISFEVPEGTSIAIIGKSGSGKSTLMHVLSGLDTPERGEVVIGSQNILHLRGSHLDRFRSKEMSFIFQSFFVEGNETCYQNVSLPLEIAQVPFYKRRKKVKEALEKVDLSDKIYAHARNLSGGQKQRLGIARAIVNQPKIIFADEPTGNLDSVTGEKIIDLLFELNREIGSTLFVVTHDMDLASRCKVRIELKDGEIASIEGNPRADATKPLSVAGKGEKA